jgi:4-amino-4-deoxy-L-arabinose transferase-like glycosyltransferase
MIGRRAPLAAILLVAALARFWGIWFGLPHMQARPDESVVSGIAVHFFDGDLNPHFFDYPTLFMYVLAGLYLACFLVGRTTGAFQSVSDFVSAWQQDWTVFALVGRCFVALLGTATVLVVYRIGARVFGTRCGLIAALFLALSLLHARDSHFAVTDVPMTFLVCASMLALVEAQLDRRPQRFFVAGLLAGLAASTKYNAVLLVVPLVAGEIFEVIEARREGRSTWDHRGLLFFVAPFLVGFLYGTPYAALDWREMADGFRRISSHLEEGHGIDVGTGWSYHVFVSLRYGVGWPVLVAALAGSVLIAVRSPRMAAVLCSFPLACYVAAGPGRTVFVRYIMPIVPFMCITAAVAVDAAAQWLSKVARLRPHAAAAVATGLAALVILPSAVNLARLDYLIARTDNRLIAARWIREHVPAGSSLYQSDSSYGGLALDAPDSGPPIDLWDFDQGLGVFTSNGQPRDHDPDWIIVQRSPLPLYSQVPQAVVLLSTGNRYVRVRSFHAIDLNARGNVFDQQDAFFLPLAGFRGISRPGPNFDVYQRTKPANAR